GDSSGDKEGADSGSDSESDGLLDKIGDVFDKVTDLFGGLSPDQELDASHEKLSGVIGKVRDRVHAFGGTDSPAGGKVAVAAAHFLDVTSDVVDTLTGFIDDTTDSSPEKEARVEMALKVAAAALKGVSDVSSLVGAAVPGISAAAPALDAASGVLEKASGQSSKFIQGAEKVGNVIGSVGHKVAGGLEGLSNKLDPQPVANNTATAPLAEDGNSGSAGADESVVLDNEKEVLVA
ncbi:MAG: hypothetical protein KDD43_13210, partial [Bdellovibrionales bacterium]|nr:hypothetical protein [Bdellovibrionales bacterium]